MNKTYVKKCLTLAVILLFVSVSVIPSTGNRVSFDDITPPVTTCTLNPPEPNGNNSWYVSDVEVTLNATDDMSGVNITEYRINNGSIKTYTEPFNVSQDGELIIEYRSIDYAGNVEDWKSVEFNIDQTKPQIYLTWESYEGDGIWYVIFTAYCSDATSGMDYVEFFIEDVYQFTDYAEPYEWFIEWNTTLEGCLFYAYAYDIAGNMDEDAVGSPYIESSIIGLIWNPEFSRQNVGPSLLPSTGSIVAEKYVSTDNQICKSNSRNDNDTTPPVTNHSFNGTLGENGYYISEVEITLNATDDMSGVNATYYEIGPGGDWKTYTEPFMYALEGLSVLSYYSVDNVGNIEGQKYTELRIDLYPPSISVGGGRNGIHCGVFAITDDSMSGEDRVEFYIDDELMFTDYAYPFEWTYENPNSHTVMATVYDKAGLNASDGVFIPESFPIVARGLIYNPEFFEQGVTFFSLLVRSNYVGIRMFGGMFK